MGRKEQKNSSTENEKERTIQQQMCKDCVREEFVDREGVVCEDGAYVLNLKVCAACKKRGGVKNVDVKRSEDEAGNEVAEFVHVCEWCGHVIARHHYELRVDTARNMHVYEMECMLCGTAEDTRCYDTVDPRCVAGADTF